MLAERLFDEGIEEGLGWINGIVKKFTLNKFEKKLIIPHMGWNTVEVGKEKLFNGVSKNPRFYFVHSYFFENKNSEHIIGKTEYGSFFSSAIKKNNIYGVQFHPEKSHQNGQKLLSNFINL